MKSFKGREVNVSQIIEQNGNVIAAGNMPVNARGDLLGRAGKILKTREQLENEYFRANPNAAQTKQTDTVGYNKAFAEYVERVHHTERMKDMEQAGADDPYKETSAVNPNLSTDKNKTVKFTDTVKEEPTSLDSLPLDDEFEVDETEELPPPTKTGRK